MSQSKLRKLGNSVGVIFPAKDLYKIGWDAGDDLDICYGKNKIMITNLSTTNKNKVQSLRNALAETHPNE